MNLSPHSSAKSIHATAPHLTAISVGVNIGGTSDRTTTTTKIEISTPKSNCRWTNLKWNRVTVYWKSFYQNARDFCSVAIGSSRTKHPPSTEWILIIIMRIRRSREHFCENVIYLQITCASWCVRWVRMCAGTPLPSLVDARRIKFNLKK